MHNKSLKKTLYTFLVVCILSVLPAFGQPEDPSNDPDTVPISGLELLLGAGALLGVKRLMGKKKEEKNP